MTKDEIDKIQQRVEKTWKELAEQLNKLEGASLSEEGTKAFFVTPILKALGWDSPLDIELEYPIPRPHERPDYALKIQGKAVLFVETKKLRDKLDDYGRNQLLGYGTVTGVPLGVLTNGIDFEFHDLTYRGPFGGSLVFASTLNVPKEGFSAQSDKLWRLSREAVESGELDNYVKRWRAWQKIREELQKWNSPLQQRARSIMKGLLEKKAKAITVEEVQEALRQALDQIRAMQPAPEPTELKPLTEWEDDELKKYLTSSREKYPLEYAYYAILTKYDRTLNLEQLSKAMTEHMGEQVDGRSLRGVFGGITRRIEGLWKKERLDIINIIREGKKETKNFGINPKYKSALRKYLI